MRGRNAPHFMCCISCCMCCTYEKHIMYFKGHLTYCKKCAIIIEVRKNTGKCNFHCGFKSLKLHSEELHKCGSFLLSCCILCCIPVKVVVHLLNIFIFYGYNLVLINVFHYCAVWLPSAKICKVAVRYSKYSSSHGCIVMS